jgi:hypothetical protein
MSGPHSNVNRAVRIDTSSDVKPTADVDSAGSGGTFDKSVSTPQRSTPLLDKPR